MKKHIGSTLSIVLGTFLLFSIFSDPERTGSHFARGGFYSGLFMILGALAYRSAKKRKLNAVKSTALRRFLEVASICIIIAAAMLQSNLKYRITAEPVPYLVIPLWALISYSIISFKIVKELTIKDENKHC